MKDYGLDRKHTIGRIGKILKKSQPLLVKFTKLDNRFLAHAKSTSTRTIM